MIDSGIDEYGLSPEAVYNGLRMALGEQFDVNEVFSVDDVMSITGETREEVILRIDERSIQSKLPEAIRRSMQKRLMIIRYNDS